MYALPPFTRRNSRAPRVRPTFRVEPHLALPSAATRAAEGEGDMIALSYYHGKPSNAGHVMPAIARIFQVSESAGAAGATVTASGMVDDGVCMTVDSTTVCDPRPGSKHSFELAIGNLAPGYHRLSVIHTNIPSYPDPYGNVSMISGTVGPCPAVTIIPEKNVKVTCACGVCTPEGSGDAGGVESPRGRAVARAGTSSGGSDVVRESKAGDFIENAVHRVSDIGKLAMSGVSTTANNAIKLLTRDFYVKKIVMRGSVLRCCCYQENNHNVYREKRLAGIGEADVHADAKYLNADSIAAYLKLAMQQLADDLKSQSC